MRHVNVIMEVSRAFQGVSRVFVKGSQQLEGVQGYFKGIMGISGRFKSMKCHRDPLRHPTKPHETP